MDLPKVTTTLSSRGRSTQVLSSKPNTNHIAFLSQVGSYGYSPYQMSLVPPVGKSPTSDDAPLPNSLGDLPTFSSLYCPHTSHPVTSSLQPDTRIST